MIPQAFLDMIASDYAISELEMDVLTYALEGTAMAAIAERLGLKPEAVRKRLGEVYKKFHISGAGPGKLAKLQHLLVAKYQDYQHQGHDTQTSEESAGSNHAELASEPEVTDDMNWDWAPMATQVYGREEELARLQGWIVDDCCRVIGLWGSRGIGKTCLTLKLAHTMREPEADRPDQSGFSRVLWRSMQYETSLEAVLDDLIHSLERSGGPIVGYENKINRLLACLNRDHCFIVLDAVDAFLMPDSRPGDLGHQDDRLTLKRLLGRLATEPSKSCLVLTSLVRSKLMLSLEVHNTVQTLHLKGLAPDAVKTMVQDYALTGKPIDWAELTRMYHGNPLALKKQAIRIRDLFAGSITNFLTFQSTFVNATEIMDTLDQHFQQLAVDNRTIEQAILACLQHQPQGLSPLQLKTALRSKMPDGLSSLTLQSAIDFLWERSLIEFTEIDLKKTKESHLTLPPPVATYLKHHHDFPTLAPL